MLGKKHLVWKAADEQVHTFLELIGGNDQSNLNCIDFKMRQPSFFAFKHNCKALPYDYLAKYSTCLVSNMHKISQGALIT